MLRPRRSDLRIDLSCSRLIKPFYTTLDEICGHIIYAPQTAVSVHDIVIDFLGLAKTWVDPATPGSMRRRATAQFLKMNDDKDFRGPKTASQTDPIELPFKFTVPRQLLPVICKCPSSVQNDQHLNLPPSVGSWDYGDDMSPDMSKIEYLIRARVVSMSGGEHTLAAEAIENIHILPVYSWWQSRHSSQLSPSYEYVESASQLSGTPKVVEVERAVKKGLMGKKKGSIAVSVEVPDAFYVNVDASQISNSQSLTIAMRYTPMSADHPPNVSSLSARLHARTKYNVDSHADLRNVGTYNTSITILKASTPSTSTPLWFEDSGSTRPSFVASLLVPLSLPPVAGSAVAKGQKVLLPSFESCLISRSHEIEVRIGFEGGNEVSLRIPTSILAKPATAAAEAALDQAVQLANSWVPSEQDEAAREIEPELLRPTLRTLRINDPTGTEPSDLEGALSSEGRVRSCPVTLDEPDLHSPPDYTTANSTANRKDVVEHHITALAA